VIFGLNMVSKKSRKGWVDLVTDMVLSYCRK
jgi:hypothetical protein